MFAICNRQRFAVTARSCCACHGVLAIILFLQPFAQHVAPGDEPADAVAAAARAESPRSRESAGPLTSNVLTVNTRPNLTLEGGAVRTIVRVGKDWRNRVLRLTVDSERFGATSESWLEGEDAALIHERLWPTLPGGWYEVRVTVERNDGSTSVARTRFQVIGRESSSTALEAGQSPVGPATPVRGPVTAVTPF